MATLFTEARKTEMYQFFAVAFSAAPGGTYFTQLQQAVEAGLTTREIVNIFTTKTQFTSVYPTFLSSQQFATSLVENVIKTSASPAAKTQAVNDIVAALASGLSRGDVIFNVFGNLAAITDPASPYFGVAQQFAKQVIVARYYTEVLLGNTESVPTLQAVLANVTNNSDVSTPAAIEALLSGSGVPGALSFTLTAGVDSGAAFAGAAGNDSYTATNVAHLNSLDTFNGGGGTNSLNILDVAGAVATLNDAQLSGARNIQTLNTTTGTVNLAAAAATAGITTLNLVDNESLAKTVNLTGFNGAKITVNGASSIAGDVLTVNLADAGLKTANLGGGADLVNVNGVLGAAPVLTTFLSAGVGNGTAQNVTIAGPNGNVVLDDEGVTIVGDVNNAFNVVGLAADGTVDAAQNRGNFQTIELGTSAADVGLTTVGALGNVYINAGSGNDTLTSVAGAGERHFLVGGAGNDTLNISGAGTTFAIAGGGNDTVNVTAGIGAQNISLTSGVNVVTFAGGTLSGTDTVAGGSDLTDTLRATAADAAALNGPAISGIEVLSLTNALGASNLSLANVQAGLNQLTLEAGSGAGTATFTAGGRLNLASGVGGAINVAVAGAGTTDGLTIANTANVATDAFNGGAVTATGVETLTINTTGFGVATLQTLGAVTLAGTAGAATSVVLTGTNNVNTGLVTANTLNAAGLTGGASLFATTTATNITGSAGNDFIGTASGDVTANLGAGDDVYTTAAVGVVNLAGGAGADRFTMGTTLTSADAIDGGSERDTLEVGTGNYVDNIFNLITNVEELTVDANSNVIFNAIANARAFDTVNLGLGTNSLSLGEGFARAIAVNLLSGTDTVNANPASTAVLTVNVRADNLSLADQINAVAGRANVLNVTAFNGGNAQVGANVVNVPTVNILDTNTAVAVNTSVTIGNNAVATVAAAGVNDNLTIVAGTNVNALSITTGSGADSIQGSNTAINTINAGAGADLVRGGAAADVLALGEGADTVVGLGGADQLTGGAGSDSFRYENLADSSVATIDTITDFEAGVDQIEVSTALLGGKALSFAGNFANFGAAQGGILAGGTVDYVFQADTNTVWVDINNDGALNGSDLQIKLSGVTALVNGDVVSVDITPPPAPTITLISDSGVPGDNITNFASPLNVRFGVNGIGIEPATAGDTLNVLGTGGITLQNYVLTDVDITNGFVDLNVVYAAGDGVKTISATITDAATNVSSPVATLPVTIDITAPATPSIALAADTGVSAVDGITSNNNVIVSGLEFGAAWEYSLDNGVTFIPGVGNSFALADNTAYPIGNVRVRQTDIAGNPSGVGSNAIAFVEDSLIPATPTVSLAMDTGVANNDGITNANTINVAGLEAGAAWQYSLDGGATFTAGVGTTFELTSDMTYAIGAIRVNQTDAAGNASLTGINTTQFVEDSTTPATPTFALAMDTGVSAVDGITNVNTVNVSGLEGGSTGWEYSVNGGGAFTVGVGTSFELISDIFYNPTSIIVRQTDAAGNVSGSATNATPIVEDSTNPAAPMALDLAMASDSGVSNSDNITNIQNVTISGTSEANARVQLFIGGNPVGAVVTADGTGVFSTTLTLLPNQLNAITAVATDVAGNTGVASAALNVTHDNVGPTITGQFIPNAMNKDYTLMFSEALGTANSNELQMFVIGSGVATTATLNAGGFADRLLLTTTFDVMAGQLVDAQFNAGSVTDLAGNMIALVGVNDAPPAIAAA